MTHGIRTLITSPDALDGRMALVRKDAAALIQHGQVMVTVGQYVPKGTLEQNALFHLLCTHIAEWWSARHPKDATSMERVKTSLKTQYGLIITEYCPLTDTRKPRLASWAEYSKKQRADLITATLAWMAESGCPDLPDMPAGEYERYRESAA